MNVARDRDEARPSEARSAGALRASHREAAALAGSDNALVASPPPLPSSLAGRHRDQTCMNVARDQGHPQTGPRWKRSRTAAGQEVHVAGRHRRGHGPNSNGAHIAVIGFAIPFKQLSGAANAIRPARTAASVQRPSAHPGRAPGRKSRFRRRNAGRRRRLLPPGDDHLTADCSLAMSKAPEREHAFDQLAPRSRIRRRFAACSRASVGPRAKSQLRVEEVRRTSTQGRAEPRESRRHRHGAHELLHRRDTRRRHQRPRCTEARSSTRLAGRRHGLRLRVRIDVHARTLTRHWDYAVDPVVCLGSTSSVTAGVTGGFEAFDSTHRLDIGVWPKPCPSDRHLR